MKHIRLFEDYNNKYKTIVILGLPGSGKSYLAKKILKDNPEMDYVIYDDYEWIYGKEKIGTENQIVSDGMLMISPKNNENIIREMAKDKGANVEFIYFENDPEKSLHNAKRRWESGEGKSHQEPKYMENSIREITNRYLIPKDVTPLPIWVTP